MTSESEAKTVLYKKTAEYLDRGVHMNSEEDAPEPLKPLLREEISKIKSQRSTEHDQNEVLRVFVSDFAGQSIYYDTHGCFVKPHCPYVLVHDLSLEFDKPAVPRFKASYEEEEIKMNNPYRTSNLDNFTSWLKFLQGLGECQDQQFPDKSGHFTTAKGENFKLPPVLIALTHSDEVKDNDSKIDCVQKRINKVLSGGKYENVLPEFFVIDNTLEGDDGDDVRKLRRKLFDLSNAVVDRETLMPMKWLDFEAALSQKLSPNSKYIPVDKAKQEAEACGVGEFDHAIKFLHRQGVVVHHSGASKVVLDPPWLMNRFTKVISMPGKLDALSRHALDVFKQKGIMFQEYLETLEDAELLKELMQKFSLICPCQHEGKAAFCVPSVAPAMILGMELEASKMELSVPSLFLTFPRQLVPMSLFTKLQVKLISEWEKRFPNQQATPSFYCNYSLLPLIIDGDVYDVYLIDFHEFIKVSVFPKQDGNHFKFASHLLATLKKCLDDLKSPDQLLFSMTSYDLEVECTCCFGKEETKCSRHHKIQCHSDRCGHRHFWKLSDLQRFYNDKSPAVCRSDKRLSKVFDIKSVKIWLNTVPDTAMVEDSSNFRWPNETSSEASSSGSQSTGDSYPKGSMNEITGFDDEVCERHVSWLARHLSKDVEKVAMLLEVDAVEIEAIKQGEPLPERRNIEILNSWRNAEIKLGKKPTWDKIRLCLEDETVGRCDVIRALLKEDELDCRVLLWLAPRIAASFRNYARVLGVPECEIDMSSQNFEGVERSCMDVLQRWRRKTRNPKVEDLIQALEDDIINRPDLAEEMREKFCNHEVKDEVLSQLDNLSI
ncbi:probable serine threonine- kinase roco4 [Paramuricea clavata]|nr:probable serine threonine- kinase roco4 [Paramuricea clavata]